MILHIFSYNIACTRQRKKRRERAKKKQIYSYIERGYIISRVWTDVWIHVEFVISYIFLDPGVCSVPRLAPRPPRAIELLHMCWEVYRARPLVIHSCCGSSYTYPNETRIFLLPYFFLYLLEYVLASTPRVLILPYDFCVFHSTFPNLRFVGVEAKTRVKNDTILRSKGLSLYCQHRNRCANSACAIRFKNYNIENSGKIISGSFFWPILKRFDWKYCRNWYSKRIVKSWGSMNCSKRAFWGFEDYLQPENREFDGSIQLIR